MITDGNRIADGFRSLEGGMDSGINPSLLAPNQCAMSVNATMRGGFFTQRPGFRKCALDFQSDATAETNFEDGQFQGIGYFDPVQDDGQLAIAIGGRLFIIQPTMGFKVADISISGDLNSSTRMQAWMEQAEDFLIIQDGQSKPLIYDGSLLRRAANGEVPVGSVMAYGMGRLWVAQGRQFTAGDLVYGPSGTPQYNRRDAVLKWTENTFLNGGGSFSVPIGGGMIAAMRFPPNIDTSTGQGPLQVFTPNSVFSVNTPVDRTTWQNLVNPVQTVSQINYGGLSQNATVLVNGDIWYRSRDGIRSLVIARRDFNTGWANTPMSTEMNAVLDYDDKAWLPNSSGVLFDNRLLMTASPAWEAGHGVYHRGLVALDFHRLSGIQNKLAPSYDGVWTGINVLGIVTGDFRGVERCFAAVLHESAIELWELTTSDAFDNNGEDDVRVVRSMDSRSMGFPTVRQSAAGTLQQGGFEDLKQLETGDLWADNIQGTVDFVIQYRPDQYPFWIDWSSWQECANREDCRTANCPTPRQYRPQYRTRMRLPQPADDCESTDGKPFRHGFEFQTRLTITGPARVKKFRIAASSIQENPMGDCRSAEAECKDLYGCTDDLFSYSAH